MILKNCIILIIVSFYFYLFEGNNSDIPSINNNLIFSQKIVSNKLIIDIQPFDDIPENYVKYVYQEISKICPDIDLKKVISLPKTAFYLPRNRYRADSLIDFLGRKTLAGHVTIGITSKDISTDNGDIPDWGVMGLSYCPGNSCVVSSFRLSKINLQEQLFKTSIHELGHTMGLEHCPVKTCLMRDAKGKNTTNEEKEFCSKCKSFLIKKGWNLK